MNILYEDPYLVAVEKPRGVLSQPDAGGEASLLDQVRAYQAARGDRYPAEAVHRLDRGTGGVILYAKGRGMAARLSQCLRDRTVEKQYLAVTDGPVTGTSGEWRDWLLHEAGSNRSRVVAPGEGGGKEAVSRWEKLEEASADGCPVCLLRVTLLTGRTHQIRIQCGSRGFPLLGDGKYGSKSGGPLGLWAWSVGLPHPMHRHEWLVIRSRPQGAPFDRFSLPEGSCGAETRRI